MIENMKQPEETKNAEKIVFNTEWRVFYFRYDWLIEGMHAPGSRYYQGQKSNVESCITAFALRIAFSYYTQL